MTRQTVAVMLDGLRRDFVRPETTPNLARLKEHSTWFGSHRSAVPSVTRVCSATFTTGCHPAQHGLEGNSLALREDGQFVVHDAGKPDFLQHKRRVTGTSLERPGLSSLLSRHGGTIVYSNVSPGAAYAHDPDGHGHVYHRAGSFAPGREAAHALPIGADLSGDRAMTESFIDAALGQSQPAFALLWLGHPDTTQHDVPLGSPEHLAALRQADAHAGLVIEAVERRRSAGDDILLIVGSDHGHQTVHTVIDVAAEVVRLGFGDALDAGELVIVPNGTSVLFYADAAAGSLVARLANRLTAEEWAGQVMTGASLASIGHTAQRGLALYLSMADDEEANEFGIPGRSYAAKPLAGKPDRLGCGQHGGLGKYEQAPFLMINGAGFRAGGGEPQSTSLIDIAPTVLAHLGIKAEDMAGRPLQASIRGTATAL